MRILKKKLPPRHIIGIDEVGRGPLAGPVTVGAVLVDSRFAHRSIGKRNYLRDSKRLSAVRREEWFAFLRGKAGKRADVFRMPFQAYLLALLIVLISRALPIRR